MRFTGNDGWGGAPLRVPMILDGFVIGGDGRRLVVPLRSVELDRCELENMPTLLLWRLFRKRQ